MPSHKAVLLNASSIFPQRYGLQVTLNRALIFMIKVVLAVVNLAGFNSQVSRKLEYLLAKLRMVAASISKVI